MIAYITWGSHGSQRSLESKEFLESKRDKVYFPKQRLRYRVLYKICKRTGKWTARSKIRSPVALRSVEESPMMKHTTEPIEVTERKANTLLPVVLILFFYKGNHPPSLKV